jgi:hypothetical protein
VATVAVCVCVCEEEERVDAVEEEDEAEAVWGARISTKKLEEVEVEWRLTSVELLFLSLLLVVRERSEEERVDASKGLISLMCCPILMH